MNNSTNKNFSIFKEVGLPIPSDQVPVTRAIQYDGTNIEAINTLCNNVLQEYGIVLIVGEWVVEDPHAIPRKFYIVENATFTATFDEFDARGILHGGICPHD